MKSNILWSDNKLVIEGFFYNNVWFETFGEIQNNMFQTKDAEIIVDMSECVFASPTPFLSLLLSLKKVKEENRCQINILLPNGETDDKKKFLNYCAREGFLAIINDISNIKYNASEYNNYNVIGTENYENILTARIMNIAGKNIEEVVNTLISEINESNLNVNKNQKLYMVVAIRNILQELIDNVEKHAYYTDKKYFALYIRIRNNTRTNKRIGNENNLYSKTGPTTKPDEVYVHKAIEVYFQDVGKGIINSYKEKGIDYKNRPLRELVKKVFFTETFEERTDNTSITGLAFLRKILEEKNNYFTVYNQFEGTGAFGVADRKININNINIKDLNTELQNGIVGQIYNFTIFDRENKQDIYNETYEGLLGIYQEKYKPINNFVIDLRKSEDIKNENKSEVVLFMPPYITKNVILGKLRNVFKSVTGIETLIISDVKDEELVLYDFTLESLYVSSFKMDDSITISIKKIFIVTNSLKVTKFIVKGSKLARGKTKFKHFNETYNYLFRIKEYESKTLAELLESNPVGKYILTKGYIEWTGNQVIKGFLNFDMLAANDIYFNLLQRNLERIMPLIGYKKLYAIDSTVERLVSAVNCFRESNNGESFGVGSVFVSGMTLQSSDYKGNTIHFFNRGRGERKPALFFDPVYLYEQKKESDKEITHVRIGKSSRIRRKDYKEPSRNTNSFLNEKELYKILHQYAYSSVLCGHLYFEKRHDLLSINLNAIMYDETTRLKEYVEGIIDYSLGHYINKSLEHSDYFDSLRNTCLILYPYNQFTSSILGQCNIDEKYLKYIIGLTPTNITSSGEDLEYSECFTEYITEIIEEFKRNNTKEKLKVVIFDTLSYSGRTKQEIYEYVNSIDDVEPCFVSIIDAKVNHYPKKNNTLNYMNINIPLLGRSDTCKLCLALKKMEIFKDSIIDASILATIENIQETWAVRDIRNYKEIIKLCNFERVYANKIKACNMDIECLDDDLYFVNALPLYLFITNRIKIENDFASIEFLIENFVEIIGKDSMAYILSLFLLEYGDIMYHTLLSKTCKFLIEYMRDSKEVGLKQLSAIVIMSLDDDKAEKIIVKYIQECKENMQIGNEAQMVFMYFLNREKEIHNNEKMTFLYNKMKSGNNRLDLYKQFHCQLKNTNGNIHNSPLMSLVEEQGRIENKRLTLASLTLLEHSINCTELSFDILYEEGNSSISSAQDEEVSKIRDKCLTNIAEIKEDIINDKELDSIKNKLEIIFNAGQNLHKRLFAPHIINKNNENREIVPIEILLAKRIDYYNKNRKSGYLPIAFNETYKSPKNISNNIAAIYYIWNNMLVKEIDYLLDNVGKYADKEKIIEIDGDRVAGEVKVNIEQSFFEICIYNNTNDTVENIQKKAKQRYQKEVLKLLGIKILYEENGDKNEKFESNAIITRIIIPNIQSRKE